MDKVVSRTFTVTAIHDGTDGYNTYVVRLYKRKMGSLPAPGDNERPQIPLWYKFSTQKLYTDAGCTTEFTTSTTGGNGWGMDIPAAEDGKKIYITCATAYAQGDIDKIEVSQSPAVNEWSTPVVYTENGSTAATVAIYKRAASQPSDKPTDGAVYTFADNSLVAASGGSLNGWSTAFPDSNGQPCWRRQATALSNDTTDTIDASEWSEASKEVEDGESPFVADINNENDGIICDDTGYVLAKADGTNQSVSTVVSLYHGNALAGFDTPTVKRNRTPMTLGTASNGVTISWNATTRTLTVSYAASAKINGKDDIEITIQATSDHSVTRTLHFTVIASTGDVYNLLPADSEIVAQRNNDGTYTVNGLQTYTIRCKYTKRDINGDVTEGEIDENGVVDGKYYVFLGLRRRSDQKWRRWDGTAITYDETDSEGNPYPLMWNRFAGDVKTVNINTYNAVQLMLSVDGSENTGGYAPLLINAIDYETISVVANGYTPQKNVDYFDGKNSVRIDLDNESDMVAVDSDGKVTFDRTITLHAKIYNGANVQTTGVTKAPSLTVANMKIGTSSTVTVSSVSSDGVVTITWRLVKGDSVASTTRTVALKYDNIEYSAVFSLLAKETQAVYQLLPSCDSIKFTRQSDGTLTPSTVYPYCGYIKYTGSGVEPHPLQYEVTHSEIRNFDNSGYTIWFRFLNADGSVFVWDAETSPYGWIWMDSTSSRVIGSGTTYSAIQYCIAPVEDDRTKWSDSDIIDLETIPIVKDGAKGNNGESPWVADINNENDGIICDETGYVLAKADGTNQSVSTVVSLYHGNALAGFGTPTVKRNSTPMTLGSASNGVTISWNATTRTLTVAYATTAKISGKDDIEITITATGESITRTLHFTVIASTGDVYNLLPGVSEIVAQRNADGTYTVNGSQNFTMSCKYTMRDINGNQTPRDIDANGVVDGKYYVFRTVRRRSDQKWIRWNGTTTTFDETDAQGNPYPLMWTRFKDDGKTVNINTYDAIQIMLSVDGSDYEGGYAPISPNAIDYETISVVANGADSTVPGPKGKDGYTLLLKPNGVTITQDANKNYDITTEDPLYVTPEVTKGEGTTNLVTAVSISENKCVKDANKHIVNAQVENTGSVHRLKVTGVAPDAKTAKYTQGYVVLNVTADGKTFVANIPVAVNYLGTYVQDIWDDKKTEFAQEVTTQITESGDFVTNDDMYESVVNAAQTSQQWISTVNTPAATVANYNTRISNAEGNISTVTKKVNDGKNMLSGVLTGTGWKSCTQSMGTEHNVACSDGWIMMADSGDYYIISPSFSIESGKKYTISFNAEGTSAVAVAVYTTAMVSVASGNTSAASRRVLTFTANTSGSVKLFIHTNKIKNPQVEIGETATAFDAGDTEVSSSIKQTADEINLSVQNNYATKSELQVTADEITSTVKQLQKGKNMLSGALLGTGWMSAGSGITPHARTKDVVDNWIARNNDDTYVVSPNLSIKKDTTYTLAFDVPTDVPTPITAVTVKIYSTSFQLLHTLTTNTNGRRKVSFTAEANNTVMVYFQTQKVHYPQLEMGSVATDFEANTGETVSQITQTASEINLSIRDGLESTGINITTGKVAVEADNFTVGKNGTQVFGVDANTGVTTMKDVDIKGSLMYHKTIIDNNNNYIKNYQFYDVNGAPVNDSYSGTIASCKIPYDTIVIGGTKRMSSYTDPIENVVVDEGFRVILPPAKFFVGMRIRIINCTIASGHQAASLSPSRLDIGVVYREDLDEIYTDGDGGTYAFNFVAAASPLSVDLRNTSTSTRSTFVGAPDTSVVNRPNLGSADKRNYAYLVGDKTATPVRYREIELVSQQNPYTSGGYAWIIIDTQQ